MFLQMPRTRKHVSHGREAFSLNKVNKETFLIALYSFPLEGFEFRAETFYSDDVIKITANLFVFFLNRILLL